MAVYTHLGAEDLAKLIAHYDVGELRSAKGIAEGISNSNWLIETSGPDGQGARYILTMYERRIELTVLLYFLGLLDHLSANGCPVPRTIHDSEGAAFRMERGKAVALIEFLPGVSPTQPTPDQARSVGEVLAQIHLASAGFVPTRANTMDFASNAKVLEACGIEGLESLNHDLHTMLDPARDAAPPYAPGERERLRSTVSYLGTLKNDRCDVLDALARAGVGLRVWSPPVGPALGRYPALAAARDEEQIQGERARALYGASDIVLNLHHTGFGNMKFYEVASCGAFQISNLRADVRRIAPALPVATRSAGRSVEFGNALHTDVSTRAWRARVMPR